MAMAVRRCDMKRIAKCIMTRASPEATGRHHRSTTRSRQGNNQLNNYETFTHFTIPRASSNGGGLWLSLKPLNATIGRALALIL
jgi:hypothetical protein